WLRTALARTPQSTTLLLHLADLQDLRGRYQDAEALYDQVLKLDPLNIIAMNNRAWLLALRSGNATDARPLIDNAIAAIGPRPELLDTRAVVLLALNQTREAIADLEKAANLDSPTGSRYFHLARAYYMANDADAAARAFRKAKELGFDRSRLHPVEQMACGKVLDELDRK